MQVICISRGTFVGGEVLAERLANKLGYECLGREELIASAREKGIQVGKLEMAITRPSSFSERLALERDRYMAFATTRVCDRAMNGGLVYHGRAGHLVLSEIAHALRVRVVSGDEHRIQAAMQRLRVERGKARRYLDEVDEDFRRWVHALYGVSWDDVARYDVTMNLDHLSVENAAASLTAMAQLPDFQMTPASRKAMLDLRLAAHCRLRLADDDRTRLATFNVRADGDVVTVTYLPHDARHAAAVQEVLSKIAGVSTVRTTMATTNVLWIEEVFQSASSVFDDVTEIATKWNAAVELAALRTGDPEAGDAGAEQGPPALERVAQPRVEPEPNAGIEDDEDEASDESGVTQTLDELARLGRAGGGRVVRGDAQALLASIDRSIPYSLVVVGDIFRARGHAAKVRMRRELQAFLSDHVKAPVVVAEELKHQYLFGRRDAARAAAFLAVALALYFVVFSNQLEVLSFLSGEWWGETLLGQAIVAVVVFLLVPVVAFSYGTVVKSLLKLVGIE